MLAHITNGNVLAIKRMLRHKAIQNTMKYIHTIEFKEEDHEETVATTPEEIRALVRLAGQNTTSSPLLVFRCISIGSRSASEASKILMISPKLWE